MGANSNLSPGSAAATLPRDQRPVSKGYRGVAMEGSIARWYTRTRGTATQLALWQQQAAEVTRGLADGGEILEVAPGPGYFAVELARLGHFHVSGLEISRTFVEIASENARRAGVSVRLQQGDAAHLPYPDKSFDLVLCQAAFKNFSQPQSAVNEMFRVLRPGGTAWIDDMRRDATNQAIHDEVGAMRLPPVRAFMTNRALRSLRGRAYTAAQFTEFARASPFGNCTIQATPIGLEIRLLRPSPSA